MNVIREKVEARLNPAPVSEKKQIQIMVPQVMVDDLTRIAKVIAQSSGTNVTRNMLLLDAIELYIKNVDECGLIPGFGPVKAH